MADRTLLFPGGPIFMQGGDSVAVTVTMDIVNDTAHAVKVDGVTYEPMFYVLGPAKGPGTVLPARVEPSPDLDAGNGTTMRICPHCFAAILSTSSKPNAWQDHQEWHAVLDTLWP